MRVRNKERCAAASLKSCLEVVQSFIEVARLIEVRGCEVGERLRVAWIALEDFFEPRDRIVVFLTINEIENGSTCRRLSSTLSTTDNSHREKRKGDKNPDQNSNHGCASIY